jgi:hypothetical protein
MLDEFCLLIGRSGHMQEEIKNELDKHKPIIKEVETGMDRVDKKMQRTQNKLNQYIESSSSSCLMTIICINILILLFIVLVL